MVNMEQVLDFLIKLAEDLDMERLKEEISNRFYSFFGFRPEVTMPNEAWYTLNLTLQPENDNERKALEIVEDLRNMFDKLLAGSDQYYRVTFKAIRGTSDPISVDETIGDWKIHRTHGLYLFREVDGFVYMISIELMYHDDC